MLFALGSLPVLLAVCISIEFVRMSDARSKLDAIADAAALTGAIVAKAYYTAPQNSNQAAATLAVNAVAAGKTEAEKMFATQALRLGQLEAPSAVVNLTVSNKTIASSLTYTATFPLSLGRIAGMETVEIANAAVAVADLPQYLDIHIVLDTSSSMGVGATPADVALMIEKVSCAFGCHVNGDTHYTDARAAGATMRIDVLRDAITSLVSQADSMKSTPDLFRFSIYTFSNTLKTLQAASIDYSAIKAAVASIKPDSVDGSTDFHMSLGQQLPPLLPYSGSGKSGSERKSYVIIVTDAVEDCLSFDGGMHCNPGYVDYFGNGSQGPEWKMQAFDPAICDGIKNRAATVSVLNVAYVAPSNVDARFDYVRNSILGREATTIAACASGTDRFYQANSPDEIKAAVNSIFGQLLSSTRLTQ